MSKIYAAIVTFEPDIDRLAENLRSVLTQVHRVTIFDNGSSNIGLIEGLLRLHPQTLLISSKKNMGIAFAVNRAAEVALADSADWLLTLDQDSVATDGMVECMLKCATSADVGVVTPYIVDRNKMTVHDYKSMELPEVEFYTQGARRGAMTSGSLCRLSVWTEVNGYDERFFIDYVDNDFNQRVLLAEHKIVRCNETFLLHEVGKAKRTWLRVPRKGISGDWHIERIYSNNHNPMRCYYKARNRVLYTRKHGGRLGITYEGIWQLPHLIALTLLFESNRRTKLAAFMKGIRDGIKLPLD